MPALCSTSSRSASSAKPTRVAAVAVSCSTHRNAVLGHVGELTRRPSRSILTRCEESPANRAARAPAPAGGDSGPEASSPRPCPQVRLRGKAMHISAADKGGLTPPNSPGRFLHPIATLIITLVAATTSLCSEKDVPSPTKPRRPNIVIILADDLGWADVGFHGGEIKTPQLDKLAAAGARLEQFYVQPVCSPTRAALMTGRYPMRHGLQVGVVRPWAQYGLPLEERTLPQALKEAGYETAICGKWHLGHFQPEYLPTAPRLRPPVRPLQRRDRLLHPRPRRRLRLAPRRQGLPRRRLQHAPAGRRGGRADPPATTPRGRSSSTCRSTPCTRRIQVPAKYTEPYAHLRRAAADLRRHGRRDGRGDRPDRRGARDAKACARTR